MLQFNDSIEYQEVVGDAFDDEVGAFEEMFGALDEISEMDDIDEIESLAGELNFLDVANELLV
ncbi:MAG: hypothetical protein AB8G77_13450 [Rhodothermales bacterium]